eukprot:366108-Chlamydomonas_euryale.AAC.2
MTRCRHTTGTAVPLHSPPPCGHRAPVVLSAVAVAAHRAFGAAFATLGLHSAPRSACTAPRDQPAQPPAISLYSFPLLAWRAHAAAVETYSLLPVS